MPYFCYFRLDLLTLDNISFEFGGRFLFRDATLQVMPGDRIGLIGRNGTGKTTLLRVIVGEYSPTAGKVASAKSTKIGYLHQELLAFSSDKSVFDVALEAFAEELSLKAEIDAVLKRMEKDVTDELLHLLQEKQMAFEAMDGYNLETKTFSILAGLGFDEPTTRSPYLSLSGGWRMRVMLAKILLQNPDLLLLDEPTNHLDLPSIEWLEEYLQKFQGAYIIVSHDRQFLDRLITTSVEIANQKFNIYKGNYSFYLREREVRRDLQQRQFENQQREIEQTEKFINRFRAKATKAKQVQSRIKALDRMDVVEAPDSDAPVAHFKFKPAVNPGKIILKLNVKEKRYGQKLILNHSHAEILRGDKIALIGANGLGKSTLLRIIGGTEQFDGQREPGHNVDMAFFAQHQSDALTGKNSILEEMRLFVGLKGETFVRNVLGGFLFSGDDVEKRISVLSGGEKSRVALAKTLMADSNFLLLDEPTNHLDIASIQILIQALSDYEGTFVVVSHDRYFLENVANKIWFIRDHELREYPGSYADWVYHEVLKKKESDLEESALKESEKKKAVEKKPETESTKNYQQHKESQKKRRKIEGEIQKAEEKIQELEAKKIPLTEQMLAPETASNYALIGQLQKDLDQLDLEILEQMNRWDSLQKELTDLD